MSINGLVVVAALAHASVAHAAPARLDSIKIGGQTPALHRVGVLQKPLRALEPRLATCGTLSAPGMVGVGLSIAPDGSIADVVFHLRGFHGRRLTVAESLRPCLAAHLRTLRYPARTRASQFGFTLMYGVP
jgi:hypothetical protein